MAHSYRYLIIGGGMTADAAVRGIRTVDSEGTIGLVSADHDPPYDRPPLSKGLWKDMAPDAIWRHTEKHGAVLHLGRAVTSLDLAARVARDEAGDEYRFERLLFATGGEPRRLPFGGDDVIYFRTAADFRRLHGLASERSTFAVIGGGFIGSEIAAALALHGRQVTMIVPEPAPGARVFPADLARSVSELYERHGVRILAGTTVTGVEARGESVVIEVRDAASETRSSVMADAVVAGLGIRPATQLAEKTGLAVDNGIVVDEHLVTSEACAFAAGDVAAFPNRHLGVRLRVEHEDAANTMGERAGRNMAGDVLPYEHLPFFYSDLFDLGYEAVGELDSRHEMVEDWTEQFRQGVVYYLNEGRVRGVLLWNVWGQVDAARALIAEKGPFRPGDVKGRLPAA